MKVKITMPDGLVIENEFSQDQAPVMIVEQLNPGDEVFECRVAGLLLLNKTESGLVIDSIEIT